MSLGAAGSKEILKKKNTLEVRKFFYLPAQVLEAADQEGIFTKNTRQD